MQPDLFDASPAAPPAARRMETDPAGRVGAWEWRTLPNGLVQSREWVFERAHGWQFIVHGFGMDDTTANLVSRDADGRLTRHGRDVPITPAGYLVIDGRRYGPRRWNH